MTVLPPAISEVMEWARNACQSGRITQKLDEFLESPDPEHRKWAIQVGLGYGAGLPGKRAEISDEHPNFRTIVAEGSRIAEQYLARGLNDGVERPPASKPLISAGAPESDPEPPRAALPVESIASPEPVQEPAVGPDGWPRATLRLVPIVVEPPK